MPKPQINFINEQIKFFLKDKSRIKKWLSACIIHEKHDPGTICYVFCSDKYLLTINNKYLKHNYYTDIITFDYTEKESKIISGDIFISIETVKSNSEDLGIEFGTELKRVMVHGILHLLGYGDKTNTQQKEMRKKEDKYIKLFM